VANLAGACERNVVRAPRRRNGGAAVPVDGRNGSSVGVSLPGIRALAYARDGRLAIVRGRSVQLVRRDGSTSVAFSAPGRLSGLVWSPDGRRLLTALPTADQWVFVGPHRAVAVSKVRRRFGGVASLDGWAPGA
jgi:hypothetical protein